jgi:hypothetical protein
VSFGVRFDGNSRNNVLLLKDLATFVAIAAFVAIATFVAIAAFVAIATFFSQL